MSDDFKDVTYIGELFNVPYWTSYMAKDNDGSIYAYEHEPTKGFYGYVVSIGKTKLIFEPSPWQDTLREVV